MNSLALSSVYLYRLISADYAIVHLTSKQTKFLDPARSASPSKKAPYVTWEYRLHCRLQAQSFAPTAAQKYPYARIKNYKADLRTRKRIRHPQPYLPVVTMSHLSLCVRRPQQTYSDTTIEDEYGASRDMYCFRLLSTRTSAGTGAQWVVRCHVCCTRSFLVKSSSRLR